MADKKKEKWFNVDNFQVGTEKGADGERVVCRTSDGGWRITFRDDMPLFFVILQLVDDNDKTRLSSLLTSWYWTTCMIHSADFYLTVMDSLAKEIEAMKHPDVSKKADEEALEQVGKMEELKDELIKEGV